MVHEAEGVLIPAPAQVLQRKLMPSIHPQIFTNTLNNFRKYAKRYTVCLPPPSIRNAHEPLKRSKETGEGEEITRGSNIHGKCGIADEGIKGKKYNIYQIIYRIFS